MNKAPYITLRTSRHLLPYELVATFTLRTSRYAVPNELLNNQNIHPVVSPYITQRHVLPIRQPVSSRGSGA
jgi:hypothetical protein